MELCVSEVIVVLGFFCFFVFLFLFFRFSFFLFFFASWRGWPVLAGLCVFLLLFAVKGSLYLCKKKKKNISRIQ
jgi:hypothetical protein